MKKIISKLKMFFKDVLTEDKNENKFSSKKLMGILGGMIAFGAFTVDSMKLEKFDVDMDMFEAMLIFSATMLGVSIVKGFSKKN